MPANPFSNANRDDTNLDRDSAIETAIVDSLGDESNTSWIKVYLERFDEPLTARIIPGSSGDLDVYEEGDRVYVAWTAYGDVIVLGRRYDRPEDSPDGGVRERVISHPYSDSTIRFRETGEIVINGGTMGAIYDVSTTTDVDGHVTDITLHRRNDILL